MVAPLPCFLREGPAVRMRPVRMLAYPLPCFSREGLDANGANALSSALLLTRRSGCEQCECDANGASVLSSAILLLLLDRAIGSRWIGS